MALKWTVAATSFNSSSWCYDAMRFKKWAISAGYLYTSTDFTVKEVNQERKKKDLLTRLENDRNSELSVFL